MLDKSLALRLFEASYIQRWNDKIRPVELTELDKHSHKMIIAYCLGKYEEDAGNQVDWNGIIKGGVFELFRRIILSDIKSPVYNKIKDKYPQQFSELNRWVFGKIGPEIASVAGGALRDEFKAYLEDESTQNPLTQQILAAAHHYATYWEFQIIRQTNPLGYQIPQIEQSLKNDMEEHMDLVGMRKIVTAGKIADFIDLCGQLRFQVRWGGIPRLPRTSVLGHMLMTACFTYLLTREIPACDRRLFNNFFGALFHDLPEAVTRDIISPVKNSVEGMPEAISQIERELAEEEIYPLLEQSWLEDFKYFTLNEFASKVRMDGKVTVVSSDDISKQYNDNGHDPVDGELVDVADKFSAFLEAYMSKKIGVTTHHMEGVLKAAESIVKGNRTVAGMSVAELYAGLMRD